MPISIDELDLIFSLIHCCSNSKNLEDFHDVARGLGRLIPCRLLLVGIVHTRIDITRKPLPQINTLKQHACLHMFKNIWRCQLAASPVFGTNAPQNRRRMNALSQVRASPARLDDIDLNTMLTFYHEPETKLKMRFLLSLALPSHRHHPVDKYNSIMLHLLPYLFSLYRQAVIKTDDAAQTMRLTKRELEVLTWAKEGKSAWEISAILQIKERTVKFHLNNIFNKLNVTNRYQAIAKAYSYGLLES